MPRQVEQAGLEGGERVARPACEGGVARLHLLEVHHQLIELAGIDAVGVDVVAERVAHRLVQRVQRRVGIGRCERGGVDQHDVDADRHPRRSVERVVPHPVVGVGIDHLVDPHDLGHGRLLEAEPADQRIVRIRHQLQAVADGGIQVFGRGRGQGDLEHHGRQLTAAADLTRRAGRRRLPNLSRGHATIHQPDLLVQVALEAEVQEAGPLHRPVRDAPREGLGHERVAGDDRPHRGRNARLDLVLRGGDRGHALAGGRDERDAPHLEVALRDVRDVGDLVAKAGIGDVVEEARRHGRQQGRDEHQECQQQRRQLVASQAGDEQADGCHRSIRRPNAGRR